MTRKGYKHTELGEIPEDWEVKTLGEVFDISAGGDVDIEHYSSIKTEQHIYPIYSNSIINNGLYGYTSSPNYKKESITITGRETLGHCEYRNTDFDAIIRLIVMYSNNSVDSRYCTQSINYFKPFVFESTGVPQLTVPQVAKAAISLPPLPEQRAIASVLSDMDAEIEALEAKRNKYTRIKLGMMQDLLTGRVRLKF